MPAQLRLPWVCSAQHWTSQCIDLDGARQVHSNRNGLNLAHRGESFLRHVTFADGDQKKAASRRRGAIGRSRCGASAGQQRAFSSDHDKRLAPGVDADGSYEAMPAVMAQGHEAAKTAADPADIAEIVE